jgi:hypothetical protein
MKNKNNSKPNLRELLLYSGIATGITVVNVVVSSFLLF